MEEQKRLRLMLEIALDETRDMSNGEFSELIADVNGRLVTTTREALRSLGGEGHIKLNSVALEVSHLTDQTIAPEDQETLARIGLLYLKSVGSEGSEIASASVAAPLLAKY